MVSQDTTSETCTVLPNSMALVLAMAAAAAAAAALLVAKGKEEDYTYLPSFRSVFS
jgi:hypothetical protein